MFGKNWFFCLCFTIYLYNFCFYILERENSLIAQNSYYYLQHHCSTVLITYWLSKHTLLLLNIHWTRYIYRYAHLDIANLQPQIYLNNNIVIRVVFTTQMAFYHLKPTINFLFKKFRYINIRILHYYNVCLNVCIHSYRNSRCEDRSFVCSCGYRNSYLSLRMNSEHAYMNTALHIHSHTHTQIDLSCLIFEKLCGRCHIQGDS